MYKLFGSVWATNVLASNLIGYFELWYIGGEGCIVTSAGTAMGVGSDVGGSIRLPSFFNGIFGHKSTTGKTYNFDELDKEM